MSSTVSLIRALSPSQAQVMELARRGSLRHLNQLCDGLSQENYTLEALEALLAHLAVPDANGLSRRRQELAFLVLAKGLAEAADVYPPHLSAEIGQRIAEASEGVIFWMDFFTGGKDDAEGQWEFEEPNGQRGQYAHNVHAYTNIILLIFKFKAVATSIGKIPAIHDLVLRWWMATCNGEIILYPWAGRLQESQDDGSDYLINVLTLLATNFDKEMTEALLRPRHGCATGVVQDFARKTIRRMHILTRINSLRHLAHWPDVTNERWNIQKIVFVIRTLNDANSTVHVALLEEKISENCLEVLQLLNDRFSAQPSTSATVKNFIDLVQLLNLVVEWSFDAPLTVSTPIMKHLFQNGVFDIIAEYIRLRARTGTLTVAEECDTAGGDNAVGDTLAYSSQSALSPKLAGPFARAMHDFMSKVNHPMPSIRLEGVVEDFVVKFLETRPHLRKKFRVRTCDNLQHQQCLSPISKPSSISQEACSRCHSVVYCSKRCQTEDWRARHREECQGMRQDYLEKKASKSWFSHGLRMFQLTSVLHTYATTPKLWNVYKGRGSLLVDSRIAVFCDAGAPENPYRFSAVQDFADTLRKRIPKHKLKRFDELVQRFKAATPHAARTRNGISFLALGLVDWAFRTGNVFLHYVALLRRHPDASLPGDASDFDVDGHLVYTSRDWEWRAASADPMTTYAMALVNQGFEINLADPVYTM